MAYTFSLQDLSNKFVKIGQRVRLMGSIPKKLGSEVRHIFLSNATQNQPFVKLLNVLNFNPHLGFGFRNGP